MTRIDHTGHNHPNTTAARTACRKHAQAKVDDALRPNKLDAQLDEAFGPVIITRSFSSGISARTGKRIKVRKV